MLYWTRRAVLRPRRARTQNLHKHAANSILSKASPPWTRIARISNWSVRKSGKFEQLVAWTNSCTRFVRKSESNAKSPAYVQRKQPGGMLVGRSPKHTTRRLHQNNRTLILTLILPQRVALPNKFFAFCQLAAEHSIFILEVNGIQVYVLVKWEVS